MLHRKDIIGHIFLVGSIARFFKAAFDEKKNYYEYLILLCFLAALAFTVALVARPNEAEDSTE